MSLLNFTPICSIDAESTHLRGYAHKDPLVEYKRESFAMFEELLGRTNDEVIRFLYRLRIESPNAPKLTKVEGVSMKADADSVVSKAKKEAAVGGVPQRSVSAKIQQKMGSSMNERDKKFLQVYEEMRKKGRRWGGMTPVHAEVARNSKSATGSICET